MAYGETQDVRVCTLTLDEEEAGYLRNLLNNHMLRVGLNDNGGPLQRIREALREADVPEIFSYSSLASRGCASMYATTEEATAAARNLRR
jgi:hypothetical protein